MVHYADSIFLQIEDFHIKYEVKKKKNNNKKTHKYPLNNYIKRCQL